MSLAWISHPRTNPFVTMAGGPQLPQPRGSHAAMPQTSMVPSCHQVRHWPARGQMSDFQRKFHQKLKLAGNIWCLIHSHAWQHDLFYALSYWMTLFCQCVMRCHVMSVTLSSVSRQSPSYPGSSPVASGGRIHSNVARYLDKPGLNMIPACYGHMATHFWGHRPVMETPNYFKMQSTQDSDAWNWTISLAEPESQAEEGQHMSLIIVIKTTVSDPGINLSQAKTSLFNELHSQGKNRGKTWLINHKLA